MSGTTSPPASPVIIVAASPTPNGGLHLGHLAGPYVAADIQARYQRACGRPVVFCSTTDDNQTYVDVTAQKVGYTPESLCRQSTDKIRRTLEAVGVNMDAFAPHDDAYREFLTRFFADLHAAGKLRVRTVSLPFSERTGRFLVDGLVSGECPVCLAVSNGGTCEACGHPNDSDGLRDPHSTLDHDDHVSRREAAITVLPLEDYRDRLTAFVNDVGRSWRPHVQRLVCDALSRPLPDFPISYPLKRGIPAPFPETSGQVLNAWAEAIPASMWATRLARSGGIGRDDDLWEVQRGPTLAWFLGLDNCYVWALPHVALLLAHEGRYALPQAIVCNDFYELDNKKFSTSRRHVIWAEDLLDEFPRDVLRFHLALNSPEHQRTNFTWSALEQISAERLVLPWNHLVDRLTASLSTVPDHVSLPVSPAARMRAGLMIDRFHAHYGLASFSPSRAADVVVTQLARLERRSQRLDAGVVLVDELGDLLFETRALLAGASPILVDLAESAARFDGFDGRLTADLSTVTQVRPAPLPRLAACHPRAVPAMRTFPTIVRAADGSR